MKRLLGNALRTRLLVTLLVWVVLATGATLGVADAIFRYHVENSFHEELEVHLRELASLVRIAPDGRLELDRPLSDPRYNIPLSGFYWQVTVDGRAPLRSGSMTRGTLDESAAHSPQVIHVLERGPTGPAITYGMVGKGPNGEEIHYVIATDQSQLDRLIDSFGRDLAIALALLALALLGVGLLLLNLGLRPLDRLREEVVRLRAGERRAIEGEYPAEIKPLVAELNEYARQNERMIERSRKTAANLAHSLRTPLAVITDEAERLAESGGARASGARLLEQIDAMQHQIDFQLARARASIQPAAAERRAIVPDVADPVLRAMRRLHPRIRFDLDASAVKRRALAVDRVDFSELLAILLDNAGKWASSRVRLVLRGDETGEVMVQIIDDGPGMDDEQIARAFEPGVRFDRDKPGAGLGLAIAREIASGAGLDLSLQRVKGGFLAQITFPARRG